MQCFWHIIVAHLRPGHREKREKSFNCFVDDLKRCEQLGLKLYNFQYVKAMLLATIAERAVVLALQSGP